MMEPTGGLAQGEHVVQFYEDDADLTDMVVSYLLAAVAGGDAVVAIATPEHLQALRSGLTANGVDVDAAIDAGRVVLLDCASTLQTIMADGLPDRPTFDTVIGGVIRAAAADGRPARAYGEMVALLWAEGNVPAALELERLWNELGESLPFSLFCAYPADLVADPELADELAQVCHLHSAVVEGEGSSDAVAVAQHFHHGTEAPRQARQLVSGALRRWGLDHLLEECQVVVSELATNAVRHAASGFSVSVSRVGAGAVHIAVRDSSLAPPEPRPPGGHRPGGRGMHLIDALSQRWGHAASPDGKRVWAVVGEAP